MNNRNHSNKSTGNRSRSQNQGGRGRGGSNRQTGRGRGNGGNFPNTKAIDARLLRIERSVEATSKKLQVTEADKALALPPHTTWIELIQITTANGDNDGTSTFGGIKLRDAGGKVSSEFTFIPKGNHSIEFKPGHLQYYNSVMVDGKSRFFLARYKFRLFDTNSIEVVNAKLIERPYLKTAEDSPPEFLAKNVQK